MNALFIAGVLIASAANAAVPYPVGQKDLTFQDAARNRKISAHIWYPAGPKSREVPIQEKGVFVPVIAAVDAPIAESDRKFPVVLLSHGSMGLAKRLFWIAGELARNGIVVLGVDHPGNMTGDSSGDGTMRVWERAKDLSFGLTQLLENTEFKTRIDPKKAAAIGHSAGATTVLLLGGAKFSADQFAIPVPDCAGTGEPYYEKQCADLKALDLKKYPRATVEGDYSDSRFKAVIALDPGFVRSFQADTVRGLKDKALVLVAEKLAVPQDEIHSKEFSRLLPAKAFHVVPGSFHMTFMNACKPGLPMDDPELKELCAGNDQRPGIQKSVAQESLKFLQKLW